MSLEELARRVEAADRWRCGSLTEEVIAAFGFEQRLYPRAGYRFIDPESGRPTASLSPLLSIRDLCYLLKLAGELPEMIHSDPQKATAAALRARAHASREEKDRI